MATSNDAKYKTLTRVCWYTKENKKMSVGRKDAAARGEKNHAVVFRL